MYGTIKIIFTIFILLPTISLSQCICLVDNAGTFECNGAANCGVGSKNACEGGGGVWFSPPSAMVNCLATFPVPVELVEFSTKIQNNEVKLEWITASETNNDRFEIYRSVNGIDWELLATVLGADNSTNLLKYTLCDMNPYFGVSYYRLKQIDLDGAFEYSKVGVISNHQLLNVVIYPNPNDGKFSMEIYEELVEDFLVVLKDCLGREIYSKVVVKEYSNQIIVFDIKHLLSSGVYYVIGSNNKQLFNKTILVL